jgi:hypothetical protein
MLILRTTASRQLFIFSFVDTQGGERLVDSWSRWTFSEGCGDIVSLSVLKDTLRILFVRPSTEFGSLLVTDTIDLTAGPETVHLDSQANPGLNPPGNGMEWCAYSGSAAPERAWFGREDPDYLALWDEFGTDFGQTFIGFPFESSAALTSPFVKDREGRAILLGTLTVSQLLLSVTDSVGLSLDIESPYGNFRSADWRGRVMSTPGYSAPRNTLQTAVVPAPVGRETRDYTAVIRSVRWLPLTVTSVEWIGQYFNKTRRI